MSDAGDRERGGRAPGEEPEETPAPPPDEAARESEPDFGDEDAGQLDAADLRDLLRGALRPPPGSVAPSLLRGVQKKLRVRSRGKFYGDGWSTSSSPRSTYLVTSLVMLAVLVLVLLVLVPWSDGALP